MILSILIFCVIIGVVITVHELGHFLGAKATGVIVEEFSIGFPPFIWKKEIGGTKYSLGIIPLGGYNKIYGMDEIDKEKDKNSGSYESKGFWAKFLICIGGVVMNIFLAAFLFFIYLSFSGFSTTQPLVFSDYKFPFGEQENHIMVLGTDEGSIAQDKLMEDDIILSVNGEGVDSTNLNGLLQQENVELEVLNDDEVRTILITKEKEELLGFSYRDVCSLSYDSVPEKIFSGFLHSYNYADYSLVVMGRLIEYSFQEQSIDPMASSVAGPVGIFAVTKLTVSQGLLALINLTALISLALGITNLLPLPALDGAKCIYLFLQIFSPKIFTKEKQMYIEQFGFVFLICLAVVITFKDFFQFKDIIF